MYVLYQLKCCPLELAYLLGDSERLDNNVENHFRYERFKKGYCYDTVELVGYKTLLTEGLVTVNRPFDVAKCTCVWIEDIDNDSSREIALSPIEFRGKDSSGAIYIFDSDGKLLSAPIMAWKPPDSGEVHASRTMMIHYFLLNNLDSDDMLEITAICFDPEFGASCLSMIDLNMNASGMWEGEITGSYWHPGHLRLFRGNDDDGDGSIDTIVVSGVNNRLLRNGNHYTHVLAALSVIDMIRCKDKGKYANCAELFYLRYPVLLDEMDDGIVTIDFPPSEFMGEWLLVGIQDGNRRCYYPINKKGRCSKPFGDICQGESSIVAPESVAQHF